LACGGSSTPTAPASTTIAPAPAGLDLVAGTYRVTITMAQRGEPVCNPNGICIMVSMCGGVDGAPSATSAAAAVCLERFGDAITIRPEDATASFRMDLSVAGNSVSGTASGKFLDGALPVSVGGTQSPVKVTGTKLPASVAGGLEGQVDIGWYGCSNNGHGWTLVPR
jgi:hypothetical protein